MVMNSDQHKKVNKKQNKKRIFISCLMVVLVFFFFLAVFTPVNAGWIELSLSTPRDVYSVGETINYTLRVANSDSLNYTLNVTNIYPNGTAELLDTNLFLTSGANKTYLCSYVVQGADIGADKSVKDTLEVEGLDEAGDEVIARVTKSTEILAPAIAIIKTASLDGTCPGSHSLSAHIGDTVTYCFNVINTGDVNLTGIEVRDSRYGEIPLEGISLMPDESTAGTITHIINESDVPAVTNIATVNATTEEGVEVSDDDECTVSVSTLAGIDVRKSAQPDSGAPGTTVNFSITVTNPGELNLSSVYINDSLPLGLDFINATDGGQNSGQWVNWSVDTLQSGDMVTVYLEANISGDVTGTLTNFVTVSGKLPGGELITNDTITNVTAYASGISVEKSASPSRGVNGTDINFSITVTNRGGADLSPVYINDSLPPGLDFIKATDDGQNSGQWVNWSINTLSASESTTVYLVARLHVNESQLGVLVNHVNVSGRLPAGGTVFSETEASVNAYTTPPVVESFTQSSDNPVEGEDVTITAHVTDDLGVDTVNLTYINLSNYVSTVSMGLVSGTTLDGYWNATIPGQPAGTVLTIYITACDVTGNCTSTTPHMKHWTMDLTRLCPFPGVRSVYPPPYTPPSDTSTSPWYPHYPGGNPLCIGVWGY